MTLIIRLEQQKKGNDTNHQFRKIKEMKIALIISLEQ